MMVPDLEKSSIQPDLDPKPWEYFTPTYKKLCKNIFCLPKILRIAEFTFTAALNFFFLSCIFLV